MATHARTALGAKPGPAAGPRTGRAKGKREAIIAAAKEVFFQEGYAGASMDRITAIAGVSKATVYNHFRSKEELLRAVVDSVIIPFHADYRAILDHDAPFLEWLTALGLTIARKATSPETIALTRLMAAEALRFPELGAMYIQTAVQTTLDLFRPKFQQAVADGILRGPDLDMMMERFIEASTSLPQRSALYGANPMTPLQLEHHVKAAVAFYLNGYAA